MNTNDQNLTTKPISMSNQFNNFVIIDDDSCHNIICALTLKNAFKPININIVGFTNVCEGVRYIKENVSKSDSKTVLFLDINMPGTSGWEVLAKLDKMPKSVKRNLVVYMLSTYTSITDHARAFTFSFVKDCLNKPLSDHLLNISEELREMTLMQQLAIVA